MRLKAKLNQFFGIGATHLTVDYSQRVSKNAQVNAGPCSEALNMKCARDSCEDWDPAVITTLSERQLFKTSLNRRDIFESSQPPAYKECVSHDLLEGIKTHAEANLYPALNKDLTDFGGKESQLSNGKDSEEEIALRTDEWMKAYEPNGLDEDKEAEKGRNPEILYRSQLKNLVSRSASRQRSPKKSRPLRQPPPDMICYGALEQIEQDVAHWSRKFFVLQLSVVFVLTLLYIAGSCR